MKLNKHAHLWLFAIAFCAKLNFSEAQENSLMIDRLSVNEGLSQSDVKAMVQDSLGFLWIGTRDGLNRYDGYRFEKFHFNKEDSSAIGFNQIYANPPSARW